MFQKENPRVRVLCRLLLCLLLAAVICASVACQKTQEPRGETPTVIDASYGEETAAHHFYLQVTDGEGNVKTLSVHTNEATVGRALTSHGIITGENGPYGLYIKSVLGTVADYDVTGTYWAFYENGAYAVKSADQTAIVDGAVYALKVE